MCKFVRFVGLILLPLQGDLFGWALLPRALPRADVYNPYRVLGNLKEWEEITTCNSRGKTTSFDGIGKKFPNAFEKILTNYITRNLRSFISGEIV